MAAENENIPMVVDGEVDEEDFTADAAAEALDEAFDARDFPTAAEMATLRATVSPCIDTRVPRAFGSIVSPPADHSLANSPSVSYNTESVSLTPVASSPRAVVRGCRRSGRFSPRCSCCGSGWQLTAYFSHDNIKSSCVVNRREG